VTDLTRSVIPLFVTEGVSVRMGVALMRDLSVVDQLGEAFLQAEPLPLSVAGNHSVATPRRQAEFNTSGAER
jgi:hypothetical protein